MATLIQFHVLNFNPRTREGCDFRFKTRVRGERHFNPRTREGCDSH